mmetsp:Transcript_6977/g.16618  ORF Transcript_6977/g.16618 Transcript_6977/m.16618 type:complete len:216 (+) Transcript_6977:2010-2657(+)
MCTNRDWLPRRQEVHHLASQSWVLVHVEQVGHVFVNPDGLRQILLCHAHLLENLFALGLNQFGFCHLLPMGLRHLLQESFSFFQVIMESSYHRITCTMCSSVCQHLRQSGHFCLQGSYSLRLFVDILKRNSLDSLHRAGKPQCANCFVGRARCGRNRAHHERLGVAGERLPQKKSQFGCAEGNRLCLFVHGTLPSPGSLLPTISLDFCQLLNHEA